MRLIDADALKKKLQEHHDFFVNAWGGFKNLPPNDKARVDEITSCIAEVVNAPTVEISGLPKIHYDRGFIAGYEKGKAERPQDEPIRRSGMINDLISREALKKAIKDNGYSHYFEIFDIIDNAPTITDHSVEIAQKSIELGRRVGRTEKAIESQKPQGEWIFNGFCFSSTQYKCSKCGYLTLVKISPCPNCGARMKGGNK